MAEKFSIRNILIILLVLLMFYLAYKVIDIVLILFASYVLSCSFNPIVDKLQEKKIPREIGTALVLLLTIIAILIFLAPALVVGIKELIQFLIDLPSIIHAFSTFLDNTKIGSFILGKYIDLSQLSVNTANLTNNIISNIKSFTFALAQWVTVFIAVVIITYYWVANREKFKKSFLMFFPLNIRSKTDKIANNISTQIGGYIIAQVGVMFAAGLFTGLGLLLLGVKNWFVIGLLTSIFDIVPIIGPIIAGVIALFMNSSSSPLFMFAIVAVFFIAQWLQNAWARPIVYSKFLDINPVIIVLALLIAAKFLGFWGVLLAPAMAAVCCTLVDELYVKQINNYEENK